jgi:phosphatidylinositol-3-phosphatase
MKAVRGKNGGLTLLIAGLLAPTLAAAGVPRPDHVVIVMEENHGFNQVIGASDAPYINSLARAGALFTSSHGIEHPSQPNYLDLFSGSNQGVRDSSCPHTFSAPNLGEALLRAGLSFAGYCEDMPSVGYTGCESAKYVRRHNPWVNFTNVPAASNLPLTSWPSDFSKLPTVSFVVPNLNNDMHDGTIFQADNWLKAHIDPYFKWVMTHNSLLIVHWDEDDNHSSNLIATIFLGPMVQPGRYPEFINHYNVLRTLEDMYGLPKVGLSASAKPITSVWKTEPPPPDCNRNGIADAEDIAGGASKDIDLDTVPDECQTIPGHIELVPGGPGCVQVVLESSAATTGGILAVAHDARQAVPVGATAAADLPEGGEVKLATGLESHCPPEARVSAGFTLTWTAGQGAVIAPGRHALVEVCFDLPAGEFRAVDCALEFVNCVVGPQSRTLSMVADSTGKLQFIETRDGQVAVPGKPIFRRGDVDQDGEVRLLDVVVLGHLFLTGDLPACPDAADADGNGLLEITDAIAILGYLFLAGEPPPAPGPTTCGPDPSDSGDGLGPCESVCAAAGDPSN